MAINMKEDSLMYSQNYDSKNVERIITTRSDSKYIDPRFKRILLSLILGTRGGIIRSKILDLINIAPAKAIRISTVLKIDYKTVLHHIQILTMNGLVISDNEGSYGATYFLTPIMENHYRVFSEIVTKIGKDQIENLPKKRPS
jgi:DNA-binding transcriptional ArsR family regulator